MVLCAGFGTLTPTYKVITSKHKESFQNVGVKLFPAILTYETKQEASVCLFSHTL